jgi:hypothetical protein
MQVSNNTLTLAGKKPFKIRKRFDVTNMFGLPRN